MSKQITTNLNDRIKVKLTPTGKEIYKQFFKGLPIKIPDPEDEQGWSVFQLWGFIEMFGPHIHISSPNVIDPLDIIVER